MDTGSPDITGLLAAWRSGDLEARDRIVATVYPELKAIAHRHLSRERPGHSLQTTALVHELYVKLCAARPIDWQDRAHFLAVAARQLRYILLDSAKAALASKRGGGAIRLTLHDVASTDRSLEEDVVGLNAALTELESLSPRPAQVVELRFFAGMTEPEIGEALAISVATVKRDWEFARAWLVARLRPGK